MYYTSEEENYRKYGIVILEVYDETLRKSGQYQKNNSTDFVGIAACWLCCN